jgi:hypothetical protein
MNTAPSPPLTRHRWRSPLDFLAPRDVSQVSGIVTRGPQGLAVDRVEVDSSDWAGLNTRLLASLPLARILTEVRSHFASRPVEDVCAAEVASAPVARRNAVSDPLLMVVAMSYLRETAAGQPPGVSASGET